jgi:hypothetical protein
MKKALATLAIIGLAATAAQAQSPVTSTDFNAPPYSDGAIIGQDGWAITGTSTVNPINVANTATNGNVTLAATGQDVNRSFGSSFTSANASSVWLSFDLTLSAANATGDYFIHLDDGSTTGFFDRVYAKAGATGFDLALVTGSGTPLVGAYGADLAFGTYHIVARYDLVSGAGNDTGALFVNPVNPFGIGDTPYMAAATVTATDPAQLSGMNLRQGSTTPAGAVIDNISVAVQAIPEPATWMLMGVGLLVGVTKRFRRNS